MSWWLVAELAASRDWWPQVAEVAAGGGAGGEVAGYGWWQGGNGGKLTVTLAMVAIGGNGR